jgi:hypothetical protein
MRAFDPMRTSAANFAVMHHAPFQRVEKQHARKNCGDCTTPDEGLQIKLVGRLARNKFPLALKAKARK